MVVGEKYQINWRKIVKINGWISQATTRHTWSEMDMLARMEKIGLKLSVGERWHSHAGLTSVINRIPAHSL